MKCPVCRKELERKEEWLVCSDHFEIKESVWNDLWKDYELIQNFHERRTYAETLLRNLLEANIAEKQPTYEEVTSEP